MNGESFISKWGYRIRKLLIILLGLELLIKIGNILLPTVIDADLGDIFRFTLENLFIFLIYIIIIILYPPVLALIALLAIIILIIWGILTRNKLKKKKQDIDLVKAESEALEQDKLS